VTPAPTATVILPGAVQVWLTTTDQSQLLAPQPGTAFQKGGTADGNVIYVNEQQRYQQMDGFGASMTDSSAWLIYTQLNETQRKAVMSALFSPTDGIGVSITRIPMGASDFVHGDAYTYDDLPAGQTDPKLEHFSIAHDEEYIIPALQDALQLNPELKVMASPWSAPAWMKTSGALGNGSLLPEFYSAYAAYFVKFIQAYEAKNIPIYAITPQNEPHHEPHSYPGMRMEADEAAEFVKNHLKPAFDAAGIKTKILIWDHNWSEWDYPISFFNDPEAKAAVDGSAFHCYRGSVVGQELTHVAHPDMDIYFTECSGGAWLPSFGDGFKQDMKDLLIGSARNWAKTIIKWNLALDTTYGPHNGGCGNCYGFVMIDPKLESGFTYNYDYYSIGHASKFVAPGAYRIGSTSAPFNGLQSVAYLNPDGSKVLIVSNNTASDQPFTVRWGDAAFTYSLPGGAAATFTWIGEQIVAEKPAPPTNLRARFISGQRFLDWNFSALAESYTIKRGDAPSGPYTVLAEDVKIPEYIDITVVAGNTYYYVVSASNTLGTSADSEEAKAIP
jgi:glucosylceramidase